MVDRRNVTVSLRGQRTDAVELTTVFASRSIYLFHHSFNIGNSLLPVFFLERHVRNICNLSLAEGWKQITALW